ncbi:hypothetical protein Tco_1089993 [Tanacetum coccineum]|uniref:Uncharacterized protein n=1 Tax=Tanacetum coccineum TaxID=301880 RepID=A0ABQ5I333_9ASTR
MVLEKKVNTKPVDYAALNKLSQDFEKQFVPQKKLYAKQAFWSQNFVNSSDPHPSSTPTKVEVPKELPKVKLEAGLIKQHKKVDQEDYNTLSKNYAKLEQHCISLELTMQLNQQVFEKDNSCDNKDAPTFNQLFKVNNLKAQLKANDKTIQKLKATIKRLNETSTKDKEKGLVITALKDELRKLKGKDLADNVVTKHTIAPEMLKIDVELIAPKLLNNRTAHSDYLRHTLEQAAILREVVEQGKS